MGPHMVGHMGDDHPPGGEALAGRHRVDAEHELVQHHVANVDPRFDHERRARDELRTHGIVHVDAWWMLGFAVVLFPMMWTKRSISRIEGVVLLAGYGVYLATLLRG